MLFFGLAVNLFIMQLACLGVSGDFRLVTTVYSYSNPDSLCAVCRDRPDAPLGCCDNHDVTDCSSFQQCDIFLAMCPRALGSTNRSALCALERPDTYVSTFEFNVRGHTFNPLLVVQSSGSPWRGTQMYILVGDFDPGPYSLNILGLENTTFVPPFNVSAIGPGGSPWNGVQVYIVMNDDDFNGYPEIVDTFGIDVTIPPGTVTSRTTFNGTFGLATIDVSFSLVCINNYYGPDCSLFCEQPPCSCDPGFTGEFCQTNIDDNCVSVNCSGRGACVDGVNGYTCDCDPGFTGEFCQTNIDDCVSVTCSRRGVCVDGVNSYTCDCDPGFTGINCTQALPMSNTIDIAVGVVAGLLVVVLLFTAIVILVAVLMIKHRSNTVKINRECRDSDEYDDVFPAQETTGTSTQDILLDTHNPMASSQVAIDNGPGPVEQNPAYGAGDVITMKKNPTYGLVAGEINTDYEYIYVA